MIRSSRTPLRNSSRTTLISLLLFVSTLLIASRLQAQAERQLPRRITMSNDVVSLAVVIDSGKIAYDELGLAEEYARRYNGKPAEVRTDGNFSINVFWTGWSAPGKANNADNDVTFSKDDFSFVRAEENESRGGGRQLDLYFKGVDLPFELDITYRLDSAAFYVHRRISIMDTLTGLHFLRKMSALDAALEGHENIIKNGGFGQPIALSDRQGGGSFWGLECPLGENSLTDIGGTTHIRCAEEFGKKIGKGWIKSSWVVEGLSPNGYVKLWFMKYVKRIRVAPARPYTLYNSWYDLRSPRYPGITPDHVMNETNILRIIDLLRKNMIDRHGIKLDAFVLDDGWDKYRSDWKLRDSTFPHGLSPIVDDLKKTNTTLGLWLGPIGGYSFRSLRVDWMKAHGYETVGDELCLGGRNYSGLFRKRVVDFAKEDGVGYYKWDGIQLSCSEPDHGHPVGIYSRRAIFDTLAGICRAVREANPNVYLNITSGTWLSPWWVEYANQIWMQGGDYGYADVPSISPRDAAMTYRDLVLYDDFKTNDFWFPIANLMTHGIIKGKLEQLGGEREPLDRFTNEAVLYFARGISMWELYVSPDILNEGEWNAISQSIRWARSRFQVLSNTEMVGGNPAKREAYGYVHFKGDSGIIAARNPWIESSSLGVTLSPGLGLSPQARSLVLERVYPDFWISPKLYSAGDKFEIPLDGYETAIYEVFPLSGVNRPLLAGVVFKEADQASSGYSIECYDAGGKVALLNPGSVGSIEIGGKVAGQDEVFSELRKMKRQVGVMADCDVYGTTDSTLKMEIGVDSSVRKSSIDILLEPKSAIEEDSLPGVRVGTAIPLSPLVSNSRSKWFSMPIGPGKHHVEIRLSTPSRKSEWAGRVSVWVSYRQLNDARLVTFKLREHVEESAMPPRRLPRNESQAYFKVLERHIELHR